MVYYILHYWWYEFTYLWAYSNQSLKHYQNQFYLVAYISHCFNVFSELILVWINSTSYIGSYFYVLRSFLHFKSRWCDLYATTHHCYFGIQWLQCPVLMYFENHEANTLDHLTFHALYFHELPWSCLFARFTFSERGQLAKLEDNSGLCFVLICIPTPWFGYTLILAIVSSSRNR